MQAYLYYKPQVNSLVQDTYMCHFTMQLRSMQTIENRIRSVTSTSGQCFKFLRRYQGFVKIVMNHSAAVMYLHALHSHTNELNAGWSTRNHIHTRTNMHTHNLCQAYPHLAGRRRSRTEDGQQTPCCLCLAATLCVHSPVANCKCIVMSRASGSQAWMNVL